MWKTNWNNKQKSGVEQTNRTVSGLKSRAQEVKLITSIIQTSLSLQLTCIKEGYKLNHVWFLEEVGLQESVTCRQYMQLEVRWACSMAGTERILNIGDMFLRTHMLFSYVSRYSWTLSAPHRF